MEAGVAEGLFRIRQRLMASAEHGRYDQPREGPADGAEAFHKGAVGLTNPASPLRATGGAHGEDVRLRRDAHQPVEGEHGNHGEIDLAELVIELEELGAQTLTHPGDAADFMQASRDEHEGEHDNEEALNKIRVGCRQQAAKEAINEEGPGHAKNYLVRRHGVISRDGNDLAGAFEHGPLVKDEIHDGKYRIEETHELPIAVFHDLTHRRSIAATIPGRHQPIERGGNHVLPLDRKSTRL